MLYVCQTTGKRFIDCTEWEQILYRSFLIKYALAACDMERQTGFSPSSFQVSRLIDKTMKIDTTHL